MGGGVVPCDPYACDDLPKPPDRCRTLCIDDAHCASGFVCTDNDCVAGS